MSEEEFREKCEKEYGQLLKSWEGVFNEWFNDGCPLNEKRALTSPMEGDFPYHDDSHYDRQFEWISVKDKTPENNQEVLCINEDKDMFVAIFSRNPTYYNSGYSDRWNSGHCCGREMGDAIYWMPLPKTPE